MSTEELPPEDGMFEPVSEKARNRQKRKEEKEAKQNRRNPKPIRARTPRQQDYIRSILENELTFGVGPAGVGKTYVPARLMGDQLVQKKISKIYVARPNVSKSKHRNGFLPGTAEEKTAPWLVPIYEGIKDSMSPNEFERYKREGVIEVVPFEYIQGRTFQDAGCIVDEAENLDLDDLYITLTRQGEHLNMVLCGDIQQARISDSGLAAVIEMAQTFHMESVGVIEFSEDDVVRSRQAKQWVKAFRNRETLKNSTDYGNEQEHFNSNPPSFLTRGT